MSPPIQRRKSKLIIKPPPAPRKENCLSWLCWWFSTTKNKVKIKEKYESVIYRPNEEAEEEMSEKAERKPEFNKSLSSGKANRNSHESNNTNGGKIRSSINNDDTADMNRKLSKTEKVPMPIVNTTDRKINAINNYHRRHSWTIAVLKLDSNKEMSGQYQNGNMEAQDQGNTARVSKKRHHKKSCDSSSKHSSNSGHGAPLSNQRLLLKAKEVQAKNVFKENNYNNSKTMKLNSIKNGNSQGKITLQSKNLASHKDSKSSAHDAADIMNESYVPPMIIDNSAVIFSSPKKKNNRPKFARAQTNNNNPLQSDIGKSDNEGDKSKEEGKSNRSSYGDTEEYDGEGESYSSSCTWSSCLREKNADNAVSLKLSQFSYKPTQGGFLKNETDGDVNTINMSGYRDIINTSLYEQSTNKGGNNSKNDKSVEDFSNNGQLQTSKKVLQEKENNPKQDFPDNLNNGKFTMKMVS